MTHERMPPLSLVHQTKNPSLVLKEKSLQHDLAIDSLEFAQRLDEDDKLASFRDLFTFPLKKDLPHGKNLFFMNESYLIVVFVSS